MLANAFWTGLICCAFFLAAALGAPAESLAQSKKKTGGSAGGAPGMGGGAPGMGGGAPGMGGGAAGGMIGGGGMMGGGRGGAKGQLGKKQAKVRESKAGEAEIDPEALPPGYHVPPEAPEALTTSDEWIEEPFGDPTAAANKRKMLAKYTTIRQAGDFVNNDDKELVRKVIVWKLSELTRKENREKAWKLRGEILTDIKTSPSNKNSPHVVRKFMLDTIASEAPKLFQYHVVARLHGAILLAELSDPLYNEEEPSGRNPGKPCVRAADPLMKMAKDGSQLPAVRVWGVNGLVRLAILPEISNQLRNQIIETLVELMTSSGKEKEHLWYQWRLAEGLGKMTVIQNQDKRPIVPQALAQVLADVDRPWLVRAEAAQSLGRLPYDRGDIDLGLVAYQTAKLTQQMTDAFNKDPKPAGWKLCFMKLYGAFKPLDDDDAKLKRGLLTQVEKGALSTYKRTVQEAFDLVLPLVAKVLNSPEGIDVPLANLKKWLDQNPPKSLKIHPEEDPIISTKRKTGAAVESEPPVAAGR